MQRSPPCSSALMVSISCISGTFKNILTNVCILTGADCNNLVVELAAHAEVFTNGRTELVTLNTEGIDAKCLTQLVADVSKRTKGRFVALFTAEKSDVAEMILVRLFWALSPSFLFMTVDSSYRPHIHRASPRSARTNRPAGCCRSNPSRYQSHHALVTYAV